MGTSTRICVGLVGALAILATNYVAGADTTSVPALLIAVLGGAAIGWVALPPLSSSVVHR